MFKSFIFYSKFLLDMVIQKPKTNEARKKIAEFEAKGQIKEKYQYLHEISRNWTQGYVDLSGANIHVEGLENVPKDEPVLFVSNHQGNFDILLLLTCIDKPKGFIAKKELSKIPTIGEWGNFIGCVFMDRDNLRKSAEAIIEGIKILRQGQSMVIFPEGTRSKGGPMKEFKAGSFKLATKTKVPIVPITINGSYKVMDEKKFIIQKADIDVYIHEPIITKSLTKEEEAELPKRVENIVKSKLKTKI
ncbi:lysophospholipid acyltransferase family protein [Clostridium massiliamazoniense]|uniref:lysophospholipid acyltransferase family protein n=1 Tax=Clostridium massiliamazoniense TaxID=1347366 RepID=UPI0006D772E3|nr:lysophospholipid acyltransferase family protein [Clostridium massiliamazoniense]